MAEKYIVNLTKEEHQQLLSLIAKGKTSSRTFKRAHILLLADVGHPDEVVAQMLHVGESTVHRTRQKFVEGGVEFALLLKYLVDVLFPVAVMIRVVLDNLNTHTPAALYQTFEPALIATNFEKVRVSLHPQAW